MNYLKYLLCIIVSLLITGCTNGAPSSNFVNVTKTPSPTIAFYIPPSRKLLTYTTSNKELSLMYPEDGEWQLTDKSDSNTVNVFFQCRANPCSEAYNIDSFVAASINQNSLDKYVSSLNISNPKINTHEKPYVLDYRKILVDGNEAIETLMLSGDLSDNVPIIEVFTVVKNKGYLFAYTYSKNTVGKNPKLSDIPISKPDFVSPIKFNSK